MFEQSFPKASSTEGRSQIHFSQLTFGVIDAMQTIAAHDNAVLLQDSEPPPSEMIMGFNIF